MLTTLLLSPPARVYALRLLLLADIGALIALKLDVTDEDHNTLALASFIEIFVHHVLVLFKLPVAIPAWLDSLVLTGEIGLATYLVVLSPPLTPLLVLLLVAAAFRVCTIRRSQDVFLLQPFDFFGGCTETYPRYTLWTIFLNRSLTRPLVRGESIFILFARAAIISFLALGVPAFAIYSIIVAPTNAAVYTQTVASNAGVASFFDQPGVAAIAFEPMQFLRPPPNLSRGINVTAYNTTGGLVECTDFGTGYIACGEPDGPGWATISNATFSVPNDLGGVYITLRHGDSSSDVLPILPLLPSSHLFGVLTWTERRVIIPRWWGQTQSWSVYMPTISGLQQDLSAAARESNTSQLMLVQLTTQPVQLLQDISVTSALSGISTFGGFWTFVNGTFALFFGANIIYFAFGRRPLSALGVVHIFQRRALVQQWHKDFPWLYSEGGLPGSEEAGIVAFVRERLVDLGERPPEDAVGAETRASDTGEIEKGFEETTLIGQASGQGYVLDLPRDGRE